ncbi:MAG TPA: hypothetical protein VFU69_06820 [Ktedonobacterales bacterium]|nr:hypothetical protein [Ktedonobacterales bacterium]
MSNIRYRKPSVKSLLGITRLKKRVKKALGINKVLAPFRAVNNYQRRMLRRAGYYSPEMKMMRAAKRGQAPGPIGPIQIGERGDEGESGEKGADSSALLMAAMLAKGNQKEKGQHADNSLLMAAMLAKGMGDKEEETSHKKGKKGGPNLAEAMLLATALTDEEKTPASHDRHAEAHAHKAEPANKGGAAHPHARGAQDKPSEEQPAPKRRRGFRLFGLFVIALVEAVAITAVWYYWII